MVLTISNFYTDNLDCTIAQLKLADTTVEVQTSALIALLETYQGLKK